jgi:outer membrane scaffolding protein for murein synthesis (MipA/OmpV family)
VAAALSCGLGLAGAADGESLDAAGAASQSEPHWEGAMGLLLAHRPAFSGADTSLTKITPGFFLRRGRFSITNASGFVTRRADDVSRGIGVDLFPRSRVKAGIGLRWDKGRREDRSEALRGLGDIRPTARARFSLGVPFGTQFRLGLGVNGDLFGRGGGYVSDMNLGWDRQLTPATVITAALGASFAGDRYLQTWYGITPEQSQRSGRPVYEPAAGWRDAYASLGVRTELSRDWLLIGGLGANRLLGPAARSPLVTSRWGWGLNGGLAWRF